MVDVSCSARDEAITVVWTEHGGPPVEAPASPGGYGSKLVQRSIAGALRGSINYDWAKEGLVVTLKIDPTRLSI